MSNAQLPTPQAPNMQVNGWLAALSDAYHMAKRADNDWLKGKLQEILVHLGGAPSELKDASAVSAEPGRIATISIEPDDGNDDVVITYRDENRQIIDQTMFENDPGSVASSVATHIQCDALKGPIKAHLTKLSTLADIELDIALTPIINDTFDGLDDEEVAMMLVLARDLVEELQGN